MRGAHAKQLNLAFTVDVKVSFYVTNGMMRERLDKIFL